MSCALNSYREEKTEIEGSSTRIMAITRKLWGLVSPWIVLEKLEIRELPTEQLPCGTTFTFQILRFHDPCVWFDQDPVKFHTVQTNNPKAKSIFKTRFRVKNKKHKFFTKLKKISLCPDYGSLTLKTVLAVPRLHSFTGRRTQDAHRTQDSGRKTTGPGPVLTYWYSGKASVRYLLSPLSNDLNLEFSPSSREHVLKFVSLSLWVQFNFVESWEWKLSWT